MLQRAVSEVLMRELSDPRVTAMVSVTRVEAAADLRSARVFFSLFGDEADQRTTWRAIQHAHGRIQSLVGDRIDLRWTPELIFKIDESLKKAVAVNLLIKQAMAEYQPTPDPAAAAAADDPADDDQDDDSPKDDTASPQPAAEPRSDGRPADGR